MITRCVALMESGRLSILCVVTAIYVASGASDGEEEHVVIVIDRERRKQSQNFILTVFLTFTVIVPPNLL